MRKLLIRMVTTAVLLSAAFALSAVPAYAATVVNVAPAAGSDAYKVIQTQLDAARSRATDGNPITVRVAKGSYKLSSTLNIYSNTTLDLGGSTLRAVSGAGNMVKVGSPGVDQQKGYYYKNIAIVNGVLNNNGNSSTCIAIGHSKNATLRNLQVCNAKDAHLVEVAGTDGFTVEGCKFYDQIQNSNAKTSAPEAIQIDIHVKKHMKTYRSEVLPMKNIVIRNNEFRNVPRGVGSHTAFLNSPVDNVRIEANSFSDCKSGAIQIMNYTNCVIEGNAVNSAPRGIVVYTVNTKGVFFASTAAKEGNVSSGVSNKYVAPLKNQNIVIRGNAIVAKGADIYANAENEGIIVSGFNFKTALKSSSVTDAIPKGNYYASGVTVSNNNVTTTGHGIRLSDVRNATVSDNVINYTKGGKSGNYYGIQLINASTNNVIENNNVKNAKTNGIFVTTKSSVRRIQGNIISKCGKYGIAVEGAKATSIKKNTIGKAVTNGIYVLRSSSVNAIEGNVIKNVTKGSGVNIDAKSSAKKIASNTITKVKLNGILVHKSSKVTSIEKNKIKSAKKYGILVEGKSKASKIKGNTVNLKKSRAIVVKSGKSSISKNKTK